jgi:hypothetical protein
MPIHDLGYRAWKGRSTSLLLRWWVIAENGIAIAWKNLWLRRVTLLAWVPALYFGLLFFAYESYVQLAAEGLPAGGRGQLPVRRMIRNWIHLPDDLLRKIFEDAEEARLQAWSYLFYVFFSSPMVVVSVLVVGLIAPPLIAQDLRSRAFILYFSRPITRFEYILGKASVVWTYAALTAVLPAFVLYTVAVILSPSVDVVADTWSLPLRSLGAGLLLLVPGALAALMFSSLTVESRYASFAWFATWILGVVGFLVYRHAGTMSESSDLELTRGAPWLLASLYHTMGILMKWVFGVETDGASALPALLVVITIAVLSLVVLYRRISAPMRD